MHKNFATGKLFLWLSALSLFASCKFGEKAGRTWETKENASSRAKSNLPDYVGTDSIFADSVSPFKNPENYLAHFEGYRRNWTRLTRDEYSGLHWGQIIKLYVNKNPATYVNNYLEYVRLYVNSDIDEVVPESAKKFAPYAIGTIFLKENYLSNSDKKAKRI